MFGVGQEKALHSLSTPSVTLTKSPLPKYTEHICGLCVEVIQHLKKKILCICKKQSCNSQASLLKTKTHSVNVKTLDM